MARFAQLGGGALAMLFGADPAEPPLVVAALYVAGCVLLWHLLKARESLRERAEEFRKSERLQAEALVEATPGTLPPLLSGKTTLRHLLQDACLTCSLMPILFMRVLDGFRYELSGVGAEVMTGAFLLGSLGLFVWCLIYRTREPNRAMTGFLGLGFSLLWAFTFPSV